MTLFLALLPLYLFGNLHCLGMCGPLVALIGRHRHRNAYFLGRMAAFGLAGGVAGGVGQVATGKFQEWGISTGIMLILGVSMFLIGGILVLRSRREGSGKLFAIPHWVERLLVPFQRHLTLLVLRDSRLALFLYGALTLALPCGQSLFVFAACAVNGDLSSGLFNGVAFAILTSPALWLAMRLPRYLDRARVVRYGDSLMGVSLALCGVIAICRGLADRGAISHMTVGSVDSWWHVVLY